MYIHATSALLVQELSTLLSSPQKTHNEVIDLYKLQTTGLAENASQKQEHCLPVVNSPVFDIFVTIKVFIQADSADQNNSDNIGIIFVSQNIAALEQTTTMPRD